MELLIKFLAIYLKVLVLPSTFSELPDLSKVPDLAGSLLLLRPLIIHLRIKTLRGRHGHVRGPLILNKLSLLNYYELKRCLLQARRLTYSQLCLA